MKRCIAILGLTLPLLFPVVARADKYCQSTSRPVASVLVIHGGAWYGGSAESSSDLCSELAALGYRARSLDYPLRTVSGAAQYAQAAAAQERLGGRPVYAVGTSAGGTIAEQLAVGRQVDGALAVAPLSDFIDWRERWPGFWDGLGLTTPELRRRWSPYHNLGRSVPLQIVHSRQDEVVPYEQSVRMVDRCGAPCDLVTLKQGGGHLLSIAWQTPAVIRWAIALARHPPPRAFASAKVARTQEPEWVSRRWLRVARRAFPGHCRPVRVSYGALGPSRWERASRTKCTVVLASSLRNRPAWVRCTALVHAYGHLSARWSGRHSAQPGSVMNPRVRRPYSGPRARCPGR